MKAIILAAGYATRLYPLTKDYPKALLPIKGKPIIDYIIDRLKDIEIDETIIVTNDKFNQFLVNWLKTEDHQKNIRIINDLTKSEEDRLGAIGDLYFVIKKEKIDTDILVVASDNLFDFKLNGLIKSSQKVPHVIVGIYDIEDSEGANKFGVVKIDSNNFLTDFIEKPQIPFSSLVAIGIYFMPRNTLKFISEYLGLVNSRDALGHYIEWLLHKDKVLGYKFEGIWYDVGDISVYERANLNFKFY